MTNTIAGLHHVTAIAGDPQTNLDFYTGVLGLRLVKITVNFDDPSSYHFYYGDATGQPGTIMTFFSWPNIPQGRLGVGQTGLVSLTIPQTSIDYWIERLGKNGVAVAGPLQRFNETVIQFTDPDGIALELVASSQTGESRDWPGCTTPTEYAIRGLHGVTVWESQQEVTANMLTEELGFRYLAAEGDTSRYVTGDGGPGSIIDIRVPSAIRRGSVALGSVHHIAWRTPSDALQQEWLQQLLAAHYSVSPIMDRQYFHSIYFRERGGVLFEIATDTPGFLTDEGFNDLGTNLKLPAWFEDQRAQIATSLLPIELGHTANYVDYPIVGERAE